MLFRAATVRGRLADGDATGPDQAVLMDAIAGGAFKEAMMLVNALYGEGGDAVAAEHGWPPATALKTFLNEGTGNADMKH